MTESGGLQSGAKEVVQAYYDALAQGDLEGVLAVIADDAVLEEPASLPYAGIHRGHKAWLNFGAAFNTVWQDPVIAVDSIADAGAYVVGLAHLRAKSRRTGKSIEMPLAELFWVADGKITRLLPFYWDTAAALHALESD